MRSPGCPLCDEPGGRLVLQAPKWRLVHAQEAGFPAFYRLVWKDHVRELSELDRDDRIACIDAIAAIEQEMLRALQPRKMNVASLGNAVPHLHWHVIARFDWDSHFPAPVWAQSQRQADAGRVQELAQALPSLEEAFRRVLPGSA